MEWWFETGDWGDVGRRIQNFSEIRGISTRGLLHSMETLGNKNVFLKMAENKF
jgi:hypothetical protein